VNVYLWMPPGVWLEFGVAKLAPRTPVEVWFQDEMRVGHRRFCPPRYLDTGVAAGMVEGRPRSRRHRPA
jgi:hypothetical protein